MPSYEIINFDDAIRLYGGDWEMLITDSLANPSMLPGWLSCVSESFEVPFRVFVLLQNEQMIGIIPFYEKETIVAGLSLKTLCLAGNLVSYHQEIVSRKKHEDEVLNAFFDFFQENGFELFVASDLFVHGNSYSIINRIIEQNRFNVERYTGDASPYLKLKNSWDDMIADISRNFRYRVRKRKIELDSNEHFEVRWYKSPEVCDELLNIIYQIEEKSWKVSKQMDITSNSTEQKYYQRLLPYMASNNLLLASVLFIDSTPVAYSLCYLWHKYVGQIKTSYHADYHEHSPGAILIEEGLRTYINHKYAEFDFLGPTMRHKTSWAKGVREHESVFIYNHGLKSQLVALLKWLKKIISPGKK